MSVKTTFLFSAGTTLAIELTEDEYANVVLRTMKQPYSERPPTITLVDTTQNITNIITVAQIAMVRAAFTDDDGPLCPASIMPMQFFGRPTESVRCRLKPGHELIEKHKAFVQGMGEVEWL